MNPLVDVVILSWNENRDVLQEGVDSALSSQGVDVTVYLVDNGSNPPAKPRTDSRVRLIRNERNSGVGAGRAQGIRAGLAPFVCLMDSDAQLHWDTLSVLVEVLEGDFRVGLAAPAFDGQAPQQSAGEAPTLALKLRRALGLTDEYEMGTEFGPDGTRAVDFAIGACQLIRRTAYEEIGGLDTTVFYGPEDVDLCLRLNAAGWSVLQVSSAKCRHEPRRANKKLFTLRGTAHAIAVLRHLWKHRGYRGLHPRGSCFPRDSQT